MKHFGFVYIWRDSKRNRYYIGSHMGTINDGYVCSQATMRNARTYRPDTFKRRILYYLTVNDRSVLLKEEQRWLNMIPDEELGKKYYNKSKNAFGLPSKTISDWLKVHWDDPIQKSNHILSLTKNNQSESKRKSHSEIMKAKWASGEFKRTKNPNQNRIGKTQEEIFGVEKAKRMKLLNSKNNAAKRPEIRVKMSESAKKRCESPEYKARFIEQMKKAHNRG